ncbi:MAG: electron transfer flavoprotein subunit beta/FixA family protein [Gemmatimonadaceae bacterium]
MKIAVCVKRVPDMESRFRISADGKAVEEGGLKFDMSDFDGYAVEVALQITEKLGQGDVTVVSLGPDAVQEALRKALSMGAARAIHLKTDRVPADGFVVARALAAELKTGGYDLILFGKHAMDTMSGVVGPMTAELLDLPLITAASKLEVAAGKGTARRELEGAAEVLEFPLPAVVTIDEGIARPRYPSLKGIMAAKKKPLESKAVQLEPPRLELTKTELPADRQGGRIIGEGAAAVPELVRLLQTEAKVL